jgi:hypothetical protein
MSQLRIYAPVLDLDEEHAPAVIPFVDRVAELRARTQYATIGRAKLRHLNQTCGCCGRITVEPIELDDALFDRKNEPIPGSATIIGFRCDACGHEWPASRLNAQ